MVSFKRIGRTWNGKAFGSVPDLQEGGETITTAGHYLEFDCSDCGYFQISRTFQQVASKTAGFHEAAIT
jgi:predicted RNA-binding Zn-ribbon protein involved in translation (DUF1610 family)